MSDRLTLTTDAWETHMAMMTISNLPIANLVSDVAVDPVHVRELADSIKVSGPISPVMVREEDHGLIDGFHRVAAMGELGFSHVPCILMSCDDETFWDLRIMSASLHKSIAFARAVDWVEESFKQSAWASTYKSAYSFFVSTRQNNASAEANAWITQKSQKWGLAPKTIEEWLYTKQSLSPDVLQEATHSRAGENDPSFTHLRTIARTLPNQPDLQKQIVTKVQAEGLSSQQTEAVAKAVRQATDPVTAQTILRQPVSRTAEDLAHDAKVRQIQQLMTEPRRTVPQQEKQRALTGRALYVFLSIEQVTREVKSLTDETLTALSPAQQEEMRAGVRDLISELRRVQDKLGDSIEMGDGMIVRLGQAG